VLTARLSLRLPVRSDAAEVFRIHRDPVACAHNPSDMTTTWDEAVERCGQWVAHWERHGYGYWVVSLAGSEAVVGFCGLKAMRLHGEPILNLFYRLDPAVWGSGLATEAAAAAVAWAAVHVPALPVVARVRPANVASARVAVKAGLRRAGHLDTEGADGPDWIFTSGIDSRS